MIDQLAASYVHYLERHFQYSELELKKIRYSFITIISESIKFIILISMFSLFGHALLFLQLLLIILPIRMLAGGLHFNTFTKCFLFTSCFFGASIGLGTMLPESPLVLKGICAASVLLNLLCAPVLFEKKEKNFKDRRVLCKLLSTLLMLIAFFLINTAFISYRMVDTAAIFLLSLQLTAAKGKRIYGQSQIKIET